MKAELRIGNIIQRNGQIFKVTEIAENIGVIYRSPNRSKITVSLYQPEDVQGVPLTEEWLLKAGFEKIDSIYTWTRCAQVDGSTESFLLEIYPNRKEGFYFHFARVRYVHQLQNVYFALCGEELNFEP